MAQTLFSVIIPTFNRVSLLPNAIDSVLAQTYSELEIIVADDGSTDGTADLVREYRERFGDKIKYFWQENHGKSVALNNALRRVKGRFVGLLDSDDAWLPEKLEYQLDAIQKAGYECVCFTDANYVNNPD